MKQKIIPLIVSLCVVGAAIITVTVQPKKELQSLQKTYQQQASIPTQVSKRTVEAEKEGNKSYTITQVAKHAIATSCWTVINKNVYDLSQWIGEHPGGESAILNICGKDGSEAFNNQHGDQKKPERALQQFLIGTLKK